MWSILPHFLHFPSIIFFFLVFVQYRVKIQLVKLLLLRRQLLIQSLLVPAVDAEADYGEADGNDDEPIMPTHETMSPPPETVP